MTRTAPQIRRSPGAIRSAMAGLAVCAGLAAPAAATPASDAAALAHYRALPRTERVAIEHDLIWIGAVDMVANGVVGRESIAAIRALESEFGRGSADGILDARERRALARAAERARERAGYRVKLDARTGMRIGLPVALVGRGAPGPHGTVHEGEDVRVETFNLRQGLRETYLATAAKPGRRVTYKVLRPDWFVVAGYEGSRAFYTRAHAAKGELRAYTITYEARLEERMEPVVVAMSSDLDAFAEEARGPRREPMGGDGRGAAVGPPEYTGPGSIERDYQGPPAAGALPYDGESCAARITVPAGDTLAAIAARCGTSVAALRAANGGLEPRDLQAGQTLVIPTGRVAGQEIYEREASPEIGRAGDTEAYRPAIAVRPRALMEGGSVAIALTGFPSGAEVELRLATGGGPGLTERVLSTGSGGAATVTLRLPARIGAGQTVTVAAVTGDGAHRAEAGPFVVRPARAPAGAEGAPLSLSGMITNEGTACISMRDEAGGLWMLDSARALSPGTAVAVEGLPGGPDAEARCGGRSLEVVRLTVR